MRGYPALWADLGGAATFGAPTAIKGIVLVQSRGAEGCRRIFAASLAGIN
jgi:hypothetical protein